MTNRRDLKRKFRLLEWQYDGLDSLDEIPEAAALQEAESELPEKIYPQVTRTLEDW